MFFVFFNSCVNNVPDLLRFFRINVTGFFLFKEAICKHRICFFRIQGFCHVINDVFISLGIIVLRDFNIHRIGIIHRFIFFLREDDHLIRLSIFHIKIGSLRLFGMDHYW